MPLAFPETGTCYCHMRMCPSPQGPLTETGELQEGMPHPLHSPNCWCEEDDALSDLHCPSKDESTRCPEARLGQGRVVMEGKQVWHQCFSFSFFPSASPSSPCITQQNHIQGLLPPHRLGRQTEVQAVHSTYHYSLGPIHPSFPQISQKCL